MNKPVSGIVATLTLLISIAGCAALKGGGKPTSAQEQQQEVEDEEAGVKGITRLLREFRKQLGAKRFDDATRLLGRAENAVRRASVVTRSHPDFEDVAQMATASRARLEAAIEQDRFERRQAAIDDHIRQGKVTLNQGATLFAELNARMPTKEDVETLTEIVAALAKLRADGLQYGDEARYKVHTEERDPKEQLLDERRQQAVWQLNAAATAGSPLEDAYRAASSVRNAETPPERIAAFRQATAGFAACAKAIGDLERSPEYKPELLIETRLGTLSVKETRKLCVERGAAAGHEADRLDWAATVERVAESTRGPVQAARTASSAADALQALHGAVEAVRKCQSALDSIATHPGAEAAPKFDTVFGSMSYAQLKQACAAEQRRLSSSEPTLRWRVDAEAAAQGFAEIMGKAQSAAKLPDPEPRAELWLTVSAGLGECVKQARGLGDVKGADRAFAMVTPFGKLTIQALQAECERQLAQAKQQRTAALAEAELNKFLSTCHGDEIEVARREGIPSRVDTVEGGRIFVYERPDKRGRPELAFFGFDTGGKRVDFRERWLAHVGSVASEVDRVLEAIRGAESGEAALEATEAALPVLGVCVEALAQTDRKPGYDGSATFASALGKLTATKLRDACTAERGRRNKTLVGLRWHARLEQLTARLDEAHGELEAAKAAKDAQSMAAHVGAAIGGFTECGEQVEPLAGQPGADRKLKVKTALGELNLAGVGKLCQQQLQAANEQLARAMELKALEDFMSGCKGDEPAVVRREGKPTRVEKVGAGRVFVYEIPGRGKRKGSSKRIAFDAEGKRADERVLQMMPGNGKKPRK